MFDNKYNNDNNVIEPNDEIDSKIRAALESGANEKGPVSQRISAHKAAIRFTAVGLCLAILVGCSLWMGFFSNTAAPGAQHEVALAVTPQPSIPSAGSYDELFQKIKASSGSNNGFRSSMYAPFGINGQAIDSTKNVNSISQSAPDFSDTNLQVAGVEEPDTVKTDGRYIYTIIQNYTNNINGTYISIVAADETKTRVAGKIDISYEIPDSYLPMPESEKQLYTVSKYSNFSNIFVSENRLIIMGNCNFNWRKNGAKSADSKNYGYDNQTVALIYDISVPEHPKFLTSIAQSGNYTTSRMLKGMLYIVSNDYVTSPDEKRQETYIPRVFSGKDPEFLPADCIYPGQTEDFTTYLVVSAVQTDGTPQRQSSDAVLGSGYNVYCSSDSLVIAGNGNSKDYKYGDWKPYTGSQQPSPAPKMAEERSVVQTNTQKTDVTVFSLNGGQLKPRGNSTIYGTLLNQYSIDEYNGYYRFVTTRSSYTYTYTEFKDSKGNIITPYNFGNAYSSFKGPDFVMSPSSAPEDNALYIIDSDLKQVGSVENLAKDQKVHSVRFDGNTVYVCTFRQVDPLFTIDISDPASPKVLSALHIPGFSDYLHVYSDGRLFGLGYSAKDVSNTNGSTRTVKNGVKLTMFDTSNPVNVTVKHELQLPYDNTSGSYNYYMILVAPQKNLIAFPADNNYVVYGYSEEKGFYKRAEIPLSQNDWFSDFNSRCCYINSNFYVTSSKAVTVLDLEKFSLLTSISITQ